MHTSLPTRSIFQTVFPTHTFWSPECLARSRSWAVCVRPFFGQFSRAFRTSFGPYRLAAVWSPTWMQRQRMRTNRFDKTLNTKRSTFWWGPSTDSERPKWPNRIEPYRWTSNSTPDPNLCCPMHSYSIATISGKPYCSWPNGFACHNAFWNQSANVAKSLVNQWTAAVWRHICTLDWCPTWIGHHHHHHHSWKAIHPNKEVEVFYIKKTNMLRCQMSGLGIIFFYWNRHSTKNRMRPSATIFTPNTDNVAINKLGSRPVALCWSICRCHASDSLLPSIWDRWTFNGWKRSFESRFRL